jgi:hypothetical protein
MTAVFKQAPLTLEFTVVHKFLCALKISDSCTYFTEVVYFTLERSNSQWRNARKKQVSTQKVHYKYPYFHLTRIWIFKQLLWNTARRNIARNSQLLENVFLVEMAFHAKRKITWHIQIQKKNTFLARCSLYFLKTKKRSNLKVTKLDLLSNLMCSMSVHCIIQKH